MTNYEKLLADRKFLIKILTSEEPFCSETLQRNYWCRSASNGWKCPHYPKCVDKRIDECIDEHTDEEIAEMWLNEEYKEVKT